MTRLASIAFAIAMLVPVASASAQWDRGEGCDDLRRSGSMTRVSNNSNDDGDDRADHRFEIIVSKPNHCIEARMNGLVRFSDDETTVVGLERGASAFFREKTRTSDRGVRFVPAAGGGVTARVYNGDSESEFDDEARRWLAGLLPKLLRETGYDAETRVARFVARGGIDGAMNEIATIESGSSRRSHYIALLNTANVSGDQAAAIVRQASENMKGSSGDVRSLLEEVPVRLRRSPPLRKAVVDAVRRMHSDGDKRTVLLEYASAADRELLLALLNEVPSINSDGDKRTLLVETADQALENEDAELRRAWFGGYSEINSDGDKRAVLSAALPHARSSAALTAEIIRSVRDIGSDGDASSVLVSVARRGLLSTPELREMYMTAAQSIGSDGDRRRVMAAVERANQE
jgi:hypothetical protein